ncbi:MAG: DNA polymerase III subunit gamma/tau, partial [Alphaproteobacteria bacterium]|nr:DNA polymerase III subunit gamma/tau [Alphaproteobacteria bacterium]
MEHKNAAPYQVLARKYRPDNFDSLIGQDALVRTLTNAIALNRLAHAFILTGVRGVGKTSTARILAKGLNCIGLDGTSDATMHPCNQCEPCKSIQLGQHVDILEMDAASHTGVDDIREIIDGSVYRPVSARFKIYIIDEVHMLSKNAFNALLKTLEEPPEAVKFIFATTEIRKVPVTILSRCQRFDLRRVPLELLITHLSKIAAAEKINTEPEAIRLLAYAAGGSVRDSLSLLDQASALGSNDIKLSVVENMLGHANADGLLDLLQSCLDGDIQTALTSLKNAVDSGAEPEQIISDLMDFTHQASLIASNSLIEEISESAKEKLALLAKFGIPRLARCWQILLKGHQEIKAAPRPEACAQMLIIRLSYTSAMPTPSEILSKLPDAPAPIDDSPKPNNSHNAQQNKPNNSRQNNSDTDNLLGTTSGPDDLAVNNGATITALTHELSAERPSDKIAPIATSPIIAPDTLSNANSQTRSSSFKNLRDIAEYCEQKGALILASDIRNHVELVHLEACHLEIHLVKEASKDLAGKIAQFLNSSTNQRWMVSVSDK